ncbi:aldehyde reductase [Leisingera sp. ANG-M1]|uniref:iron-containing alcohol dehydrogenase n=1 Tax=Leisingera sp. ANG-M1 TaxID=1577895 RepID=UPI00057C4A4D|nr:iron-containing alcohol dehydrogenase [Leisingera sp. ANG-M1]KIC08533.1 aldehyde reductase [Leisingera sp. ANG-M1]
MSHTFNFQYSAPTRIHFGVGKISGLSTAIPLDERVLVLYGGGSIKKNGTYDAVISSLSGHDIREFGGVEANPEYETLTRAVSLVRDQGISLILAVGGGSVIDAAKYIAAASLYGGDGWDLLDGSAPVVEALSVGVVLTTAATGSETNAYAVISDKARGLKLALTSDLVVPKFAIMDPQVLSSLPRRQLANGLADAFVHCCEQYLTYPVGAPIQDGYAEAVMRTLVSLANDIDQVGTLEWNQNMMWAANQALSGILGLGVPGDFASHVICRSLTVFWGIDHARTLTIIQPALLRESLAEKAGKLAMLGENVFGMERHTPLQVVERIEDFYRTLGLPLSLRDAGVTDGLAVPRILASLEAEGITSLGENGIFTPARIRRIAEACVEGSREGGMRT